MSARRMIHSALVVTMLSTLMISADAHAKKDAFIEFTAGDVFEVEVWKNSHFNPTGDIYYNRVDGLLVYMGVQYRAEKALHPRFDAVVGWPSARGDSYYQIDIEQPFHDQDSFAFGVNLYDRSAWSLEDTEWITDFGNNIQAFFAREDDRDYFRQDGVTVYATHKLSDELRIRAEFQNHELTSLSESQSVWSMFGKGNDWRENPPLERGVLQSAEEFEGRMSNIVLSAEYDSRNEDMTTGWWVRGISENGITGASGDYEFKKHTLEGRKLFPITSTQTLEIYGQWGISSGTDFPSHKLYHLGGLGNLRGYDYKQFTGKEIVFGRAEYRVQISKPMQMLYFVESGQVSYSTTTPYSDDSDGFKHDAGLGFRIEAPWDGWLGVDVARAMEEESEINVYFRLLLSH
jgi:outer membrane protein assembly factor BamA